VYQKYAAEPGAGVPHVADDGQIRKLIIIRIQIAALMISIRLTHFAPSVHPPVRGLM